MPAIDVNGERIEYLRQGSGTPLVLLHGVGANAALWAETIAALDRNHDVCALNLRGHGGSSCNGDLSAAALASDIVAAAGALGLESFHLAGVSLGGAVAVHVAATAPGRVRSLVVAGAGAGEGQALADEIYGIREAVHYLVPDDFAQQVGEALLAPDSAAERVAALADSITILTKQRYLRALEALAGAGLAELAGRVTAPTLVLRGALDELVTDADAAALARAVAGAKQATLPEAGHLANIDDPSGFAAALTAFVGALAA